MKIAIVGAGAIGGYLAVRLALAGNDVTVVARGGSLDAVRAGGIRLLLPDGTELHARDLRATTIDQAGPHDYVLLTMKAHQVAPVAAAAQSLCDDETAFVTMQNGVPWWYFHRHGGGHEGTRLESVDPGGTLWQALRPERAIGCVVYPACHLESPGVVRLVEGDRFTLGEPSGEKSGRVANLARALIDAGFRAPVSTDIRSEIWVKLWGNLAFNPISALTHATLEELCRFPASRALAECMMAEAREIGERLGVRFKVSIEQRIAGAERVGAHKTSMLQDVEQGKALELDALVGAVLELGRLTGVATPAIEAVHALAALLADNLSRHAGRLRIEPAVS